MSKITDYGFLFQQMFGTKGTKSTSAIGSFQLSQLNSGSVQAQLRADYIKWVTITCEVYANKKLSSWSRFIIMVGVIAISAKREKGGDYMLNLQRYKNGDTFRA